MLTLCIYDFMVIQMPIVFKIMYNEDIVFVYIVWCSWGRICSYLMNHVAQKPGALSTRLWDSMTKSPRWGPAASNTKLNRTKLITSPMCTVSQTFETHRCRLLCPAHPITPGQCKSNVGRTQLVFLTSPWGHFESALPSSTRLWFSFSDGPRHYDRRSF